MNFSLQQFPFHFCIDDVKFQEFSIICQEDASKILGGIVMLRKPTQHIIIKLHQFHSPIIHMRTAVRERRWINVDCGVEHSLL